MSDALIHKRGSFKATLCPRTMRAGDSTTDYWDTVTCPSCLDLKPADTGGRTSIKRSHRAEGVNFID